MGGGFKPKGKTLDKVVNNVFKGHFFDFYDLWFINSPIVAHTVALKAPTRQLLEYWVVKAWNFVP